MSAPENLTVFNGIDISQLIVVEDVARPVLAKRKLDTKHVPGVQGSYIMAHGYETVTIKLSCRLRYPRLHDIADTLHELAHVLQTDEPHKLILPDDPTRSYQAIYAGGDTFKSDLFKTKFSLTFQLVDPIAYGGHHKETIKPHKDGTTEDIMLVGGTYPTKPKITFTVGKSATSTEVLGFTELMNKTAGKRISLTGNFKSAQIIEIDCELERVTVSDFTIKKYSNGEEMVKTNPRYLAPDIESDFFDIKDGDILYHSPNIYTYTIEWDERYL